MNAPAQIDAAAPKSKTMRPAPTPEGLEIIIRDERFNRDAKPRRWWAGDAFGTAWHNALSATFPRGEAFFIEAVKAHRAGADPKLEAEIRAFVRQEINHTREHVAFNRLAEDAGYDIAKIDKRVEQLLALTKGRPPIANLLVTMALEHYTAMMAHEFLANPSHFEDSDPEVRAMWRWHAVEEIEHKGVAYDTFEHATRDWTPFRRWMRRSVVMLIVTRRFLFNRWIDAMDLLAQDGITGWKARWGLFKYLTVTPGVLRRIFPAWLSYFRPGFHPWDHDDRALIGKYEGEFEAALMPAE
ncbi:metal-dependent hydrolase [Qipengyuania sp. DY56-A-20]|jgi:predicted metal-dependent hydrolase|uniref:Metal-dependent hydrolase n=1 Tax=Qipengyuania benthica TaxID=3067651 RepID=A0ABT9HC58_9SPHN|nr:metal-dependent hydrolase [Qipengyuania sp. DY56-A-20]MDP4540919.1 metal-dependent hydrolase [Qipengyuania sp. DY56-A-20]